MPVDVESPSYELLGKYSDDDGVKEEEEGTDDMFNIIAILFIIS